MNSIGSAAGYCQIHKMDKMFVGLEDATEPTCVRCVADATPKIGRTQTVQDPGEAYFHKGAKTDAKSTTLESEHGVGKAAVAAIAGHIPAVEVTRLEDVIGIAVAQLKRLPMPEDIKQFKAVQKAIKTLESLVEKTNG